MSVSDSYRTFVLEQLGRAAQRLRSKSMFGGVGVYSGDHFFALIDNDTLFFKVDDTNRHDFIAARMKAWSPFEDGKEMKGYYELPPELLEDPDQLRSWIEKAVAVAAGKKKKKSEAGSRKAKAKAKTKAKPKKR
jgi:DNA transformation protein